ncbi:MAG: DUF5906 domain-containing protein [Nitrososphaerota archaeon]
MNKPTSAELKEWAKRYHELGFVVIRLKPRSKAGYPGWPSKTRYKDDTNCNWHDGDNIGILLGEKSNLVCFEIENHPKNNPPELINYWCELLETYGKIKTFTATSARGGVHNYFKYETLNSFLKPKNRLNIKVPEKNFAAEFRSNGHYMAVYPSIVNIDGVEYNYQMPELSEVSDMPQWLTDFILIQNQINSNQINSNQINSIDSVDSVDIENIDEIENIERNTISNTDEADFLFLLDSLPDEYWNSYENWWQALGAMWNFYECSSHEANYWISGNFYNLCYKYTSKSHHFKPNDEDGYLLAKLKSFMTSPPHVGWTHISREVMKYNPNAYKQLFETNIDELSIEFQNLQPPYYDNLFVNENKITHLIGGRKLNNLIKRVIAVVINEGNELLALKTKNGFSFVSSTSPFTFAEVEIKAKEKTIRIKFTKYLASIKEQLIHYSKLDFMPHVKKDKCILNLFTGYECNKNQAKPGELEVLLHHLRKVWCKDNDEIYDYLIKWFAWIFQRNESKTGVAIILHSPPGCGKSIIVDFIGNKVLGEKYYTKVNSWDKLLQRFNSHLMHKILICGEELSTDNIFSNKVNYEKLKSMITDDTLEIEVKYKEPIKIQNHANYVFCTNGSYGVSIERDDRRYFCLDLSSEYKNNKSYFKKLAAALNENTAHDFYEFLMKVNLEDFTPDHPPITESKNELIAQSLSSVHHYVAHLVENDWCGILETTKVKANNTNITFIRTDNIWNDYIAWCASTNRNPFNQTNFYNKLNEIGFKKSRIRINGSRPNIFILDVDNVKQQIKAIIKDEIEIEVYDK